MKPKYTVDQLRLRWFKSELNRTYDLFQKSDSESGKKIFRTKINYLLKQIQELEPVKTLEQQEAISDYIEIYGREDEWTDETIEQAEQDMIDR